MSKEPHRPLLLQGTRKYEFIIHELPRSDAYVHALSIETLKQFVLQTRPLQPTNVCATADRRQTSETPALRA